MINIGYGNFVQQSRVVAILNPESAPVKRLIQEMKKSKTLLDATFGHKTRAVLALDNGSLILSSHSPEILAQNFSSPEEEK